MSRKQDRPYDYYTRGDAVGILTDPEGCSGDAEGCHRDAGGY